MKQQVEELLSKMPRDVAYGNMVYIEMSEVDKRTLIEEIEDQYELVDATKGYNKDFGNVTIYNISGWRLYIVVNNKLKEFNYVGFKTILDGRVDNRSVGEAQDDKK